MKKLCSMCGWDKDSLEFYVSARSKDGLQSRCKSCAKKARKDHYLAGGKELKQVAAKAWRDKNRQNLFEYLSKHSCIHCGESDPVVLEFDHRDENDKLFNIGDKAKDMSWSNLLKEIDKCDVLCANCHRRRTAKQFGWSKLTLS